MNDDRFNNQDRGFDNSRYPRQNQMPMDQGRQMPPQGFNPRGNMYTNQPQMGQMPNNYIRNNQQMNNVPPINQMPQMPQMGQNGYFSQQEMLQQQYAQQNGYVQTQNVEEFADQFDYYPNQNQQPPQEPLQQRKKKGFFASLIGGKKQETNSNPYGNMNGVIFFYPKSVEEIAPIIDSLRSGRAAIVNFEKVNEKYVQRSLDYLSGAIYALGGFQQHISDTSFLFTPDGVGIQGPLK